MPLFQHLQKQATVAQKTKSRNPQNYVVLAGRGRRGIRRSNPARSLPAIWCSPYCSPVHRLLGLCAEWNIHRGTSGSKWRVGETFYVSLVEGGLYWVTELCGACRG